MKDLKHIYDLEALLQESYNDLVRQAKEQNEIVIGSTCSLIPEPLLNLPGCFSVRLRAPRTGSMEMGTYYMTSIMCEACRAILERAIEGGYQFLDCMLTPDSCAQMNRCVENMEHLKLCGKEGFFVTYADVPHESRRDSPESLCAPDAPVCVGTPDPAFRHRYLGGGTVKGCGTAQPGGSPDPCHWGFPQGGKPPDHGL